MSAKTVIPTSTTRVALTAISIPTDPNIIFLDDFSNQDSSRMMVADDKTGKMFYSDGTYHILIYARDLIVWGEVEKSFDNGILSVDIKHVSGDEHETGSAILWRITDTDNYYAVELNNSGEYSIWKLIDKEWTALSRWTSSSAIKTNGGLNNLVIAFYGETADIFINDYFVESIIDTTFKTGWIAVGAFASTKSDVEVTFDNLVIYKYDPNSPYLPSKTNVVDSKKPTQTNQDIGCVSWESIKLSDVGKTICVYGTVRNSWYSDNQVAHIITFSDDPNTIYFIMKGFLNYDENSMIGHCAQLTNKIYRVYDTPVMYIEEGDALYKCDE